MSSTSVRVVLERFIDFSEDDLIDLFGTESGLYFYFDGPEPDDDGPFYFRDPRGGSRRSTYESDLEQSLRHSLETMPDPGAGLRNAERELAVDSRPSGTNPGGSCAICLETVATGCPVPVLECGHGFHWDCLTAWVKEAPSCPVCRRPIKTLD